MLLLPECKEDDVTEVFCKCSVVTQITYEPVGRWFEACLKRQRSGKSVSLVEEEKQVESDDEEELSEDDKLFMLSLNAVDWKKQDHYKVLGIPHMRWTATDEDIKRAYRKKVLKYHPDKKTTQKPSDLPPGLSEHDYFTCIQRAFETLSTIQGRQAYDSVDPTVSDVVPTYSSKQDFFKVFDQTFKNNSRWSRIQPVPLLGDMNTSQDDVNSFYSFWYDFKSWRDFSYLDDDEQGESREERRWIERENRRMRQKKKKEEIQRIRGLVDTAYQNDPRLKKFKEEEKKRKLEEKEAKALAEKELEKQRQQKREEERKLKEEAEQEAKEKALKEKKEKDKLKKAAARDRKIIRQAVKAAKFFSIDKDEVAALERLEQSMQTLSLESLQELREAAEGNDKNAFKSEYIKQSNDVLEKVRLQKEELRKQEEESLAVSAKQSSASQSNTDQLWTEEELKMLVKASQLFPVGTASRWDVIANYVNEHSGSNSPKTAKHVINKVKKLKKHDASLKDEVNKMAYKNLEKATNAKLNQTAGDNSSSGNTAAVPDNPWSSDEQKLLEQALKTYGASTPERWDKIASLIPSRTKKDCMKRYKELVEMVKAKKKAAQAS